MGGRKGPVRWLRFFGIGKPRVEESVDWEIEHHLAELRDRLVAEGLDEAVALEEAIRRFGDARRYRRSMKKIEKQRAAMVRGAAVAEMVRSSGSGLVRTARRYPGFTTGVVVTLALGIGANATMYGIIDRLLLQPPEHVVDHDEVRRVMSARPNPITGESTPQRSMTYPDVQDLLAHPGLSSIATHTSVRESTVGSGESATRAQVSLASAAFFPLLGVQPAIGRFYTEEESAAGAPLTVVLSHEYWERAYGEDSDVLGRTIELGGRVHTIVGVAPSGFTGVDLQPVDAWLPLEATHVAINGDGHCLNGRRCWWVYAVARLRSGVTADAAEAEATRLHLNGRREQIEAGRYSDRASIELTPLIAAEGPDASAEAQVARWLTGVSIIVLLIACANVANLLLARGTRHAREVGVRLALGAGRSRLVAQSMLESVWLALVGGGVAVLLARWGGGLVRSTLLPGVYFPDSAVNPRVVGFTLIASVLAGLIAGLGPALQASREHVVGVLIDGARGSSRARSRVRGALTVLQAAMSVILLVGAGLFIRSLGELRALDLGLDTERLLMARLEFRAADLDRERRTELYLEAIERLRATPAVEVSAAAVVPFQWGYSTRLRVLGLDSIPSLPGGGPYHFPVTADYFATVGVEIVQGRALAASDGPDNQKVAIVSETMARTLWPDANALGQCLMVGSDATECTTVVGVAEDAARDGYQDEPFHAYYLPLSQLSSAPQALYVRSSGDATAAVGSVAQILRSFSSEIRYADVRSFEEILDPQARSWTLGATMFTVFGVLALSLAAIGLYGVLAFDVVQRTREIGIRSALGAEKGPLIRGVVAAGSRLALFGVVAGLAISFFSAPYAAELLFQVSPRDPVILTSVGALLAIVGLLASLVPAFRATRVDPMVALRTE